MYLHGFSHVIPKTLYLEMIFYNDYIVRAGGQYVIVNAHAELMHTQMIYYTHYTIRGRCAKSKRNDKHFFFLNVTIKVTIIIFRIFENDFHLDS